MNRQSQKQSRASAMAATLKNAFALAPMKDPIAVKTTF
jgi:hypothetical protein